MEKDKGRIGYLRCDTSYSYEEWDVHLFHNEVERLCPLLLVTSHRCPSSPTHGVDLQNQQIIYTKIRHFYFLTEIRF